MSPVVRTEDLIDAREVARVLGLAQPNSVSLYQRRYPDTPWPVLNLGPKRPTLWLRQKIEAWSVTRRLSLGRDPDRSRAVAHAPDIGQGLGQDEIDY